MPPKKPKKQGDRHAAKRIAVNFTEDWHAVIRKLAGQNRQPTLWYLLGLIREEAKRAGLEIPQVPWEEVQPGESQT